MAVSAKPTTTTIHRSTMFKVPDPENQKKLVEAYRVLETEQQKVCLVFFLFLNLVTDGMTTRPDLTWPDLPTYPPTYDIYFQLVP